jgi:hypothetical protein
MQQKSLMIFHIFEQIEQKCMIYTVSKLPVSNIYTWDILTVNSIFLYIANVYKSTTNFVSIFSTLQTLYIISDTK